MRRFNDRANDPLKQWKLTEDDWRNRAKRSEYLKAINDMLDWTDHPRARWDLIAAEDKHFARVAVLETLVDRWVHDLDAEVSRFLRLAKAITCAERHRDIWNTENMTSRYGITIPFDGVTLSEHKEWFHRLADLGYSDVWSAEVDGADGFTPLTLAAAWESRLNLGVAVTPAFTRGPGLLAMSVAALAEVAGGRFIMGLGSSSMPVVQSWNGIAFEQPYAKTRDVLRFVKRALDGEKIDEVFETFEVHGFKLSRPVIERPPILLGALRPGCFASRAEKLMVQS